MVLYQCPRCHYETTQKSHMRNHYSRKTVCKTAFSRKSVKDCLQELESKGGMKMSEEIEELKKKNKEVVQKAEKDYRKRLDEIFNERNYVEMDSDNSNYVYMIREREFVKTKEPVYKIGKTINPKSRLSSYPKGSEILFISLVSDCDKAEEEIMKIFNNNFIHRKDIGKEYFQGDTVKMMKEIIGVAYQF